MSKLRQPGYRPESLMMGFGYKPELSEGSLKVPIFQTSTFVFRTAEEGKRFFAVAYGKSPKSEGEELGLIYSRINNPDLEILEERLRLWDEAEAAAVFESGMAAVSTVLLEFLKPGDLLLYSSPLYGGSHHFIHHVLPTFGIESLEFDHHDDEAAIAERIRSHPRADRLRMIYVETPANPTNDLIDLKMVVRLANTFSSENERVFTAVDNTYLGPMWQKPLRHGIDLSLYSATKFLGGHSDLIAGSVCGCAEVITRVKTLRTFLGNMASPHTGWLLMRSLETLKVRTDRQALNARLVADFLKDHPKVTKVYYLGHLKPGSTQAEIFSRQCENAGAMVSFDIAGGEAEAFRFLNALDLFNLAVSLGGTESLASHPASMTHCDIPDEDRARIGIGDTLCRLSIGVEDPNDLIADILQALEKA